MKYYEEKFWGFLKGLVIGIGIGFVAAIIFGFLAWGSVDAILSNIPEMGLLGLICGLMISIFTTGSKTALGPIMKWGLRLSMDVLRGGFAMVSNSPYLIVIFICKAMISGIVFMGIFAFVMVAFPINVIYIIVMFIVEKVVGEVDSTVAIILDKVVIGVAIALAGIMLIWFLSSAL